VDVLWGTYDSVCHRLGLTRSEGTTLENDACPAKFGRCAYLWFCASAKSFSLTGFQEILGGGKTLDPEAHRSQESPGRHANGRVVFY